MKDLNRVGNSYSKSATTILNYYSDGSNYPNFETYLSGIESRASLSVKKLVQRDLQLTQTEDQFLFEFVIAMSLRSPRSRRLVQDIATIMKNTNFVEVAGSDKPRAVHRDAITSDDIVLEDFSTVDVNDEFDSQIKNMHYISLQRILDNAKELREIFELKIVEFQRKRLITSDSPVLLFSDSVTHVGFASAHQIYLPISPHIGLFYSNKMEGKIDIFPTVALQEELNGAIIRNARKFLISHVEDRELIEHAGIDSEVGELDIEAVYKQMGFL